MDHFVIANGEPLECLKFIMLGLTPAPAFGFRIPSTPLVGSAFGLAAMPRGELDSAAIAAATLLHMLLLDAVKRILGV